MDFRIFYACDIEYDAIRCIWCDPSLIYSGNIDIEIKYVVENF